MEFKDLNEKQTQNLKKVMGKLMEQEVLRIGFNQQQRFQQWADQRAKKHGQMEEVKYKDDQSIGP